MTTICIRSLYVCLLREASANQTYGSIFLNVVSQTLDYCIIATTTTTNNNWDENTRSRLTAFGNLCPYFQKGSVSCQCSIKMDNNDNSRKNLFKPKFVYKLHNVTSVWTWTLYRINKTVLIQSFVGLLNWFIWHVYVEGG